MRDPLIACARTRYNCRGNPSYGVALGAIPGRRTARSYQVQAARQTDEPAKAGQESAEVKLEKIKKAFRLCLEAKEYMVRYL